MKVSFKVRSCDEKAGTSIMSLLLSFSRWWYASMYALYILNPYIQPCYKFVRDTERCALLNYIQLLLPMSS